MVKSKVYPNYINYYYYTKGSKIIKFERKIGNKTVYINYMKFDTVEDARFYFENECGAWNKNVIIILIKYKFYIK